MVLQRYPSVSRGRSMRQAANVGMQAGHDILKIGMDAQYSQQQAQVKALDTGFMADLDKELWNNRGDVSQWGKILEDKYKKYVQERSKNVTNPRLKKEMLANQRLEKAVLDKYIQEEAQKQSIINNKNALDTMDLSVSQYSYNNITVMQKSQADYLKSYGEIAKVLNISEAEQIEHVDKVWSKAVERFLISSGNEEWINNPNKFAEDNALNGEIGRPLFNDAEVDDLKKDYKAIKDNAKRKKQEERDLRHDKNGRELLARAWDDDPNNQPTPQEIANAVHPDNDLITESMGKYLIGLISDTSGKKFNLEKYNEVKETILNYQMNPSNENKQKALDKLYENSKYLDTEGKTLLNELYSDIGRAEAADKNEAYSDMAAILGGAPDISNLGNFIFGRDKDREAWILAKIRWDEEVQKAKDAGKSLKRIDKRLTAVRIARQVSAEIEGKTPEEFLPTENKTKPPTEQRLSAVTGLEEIWEKMNDVERRYAIRALSLGKSSQEIINYFNQNR